MKLLLLSNSKVYDHDLLQHAKHWIQDHFKNCKKILFIPYADKDYEAYGKRITKAFISLGINVEIISAHNSDNPVKLLDNVDGIFVGGGNTFVLLNSLRDMGLLNAISEKVRNGMPYMGSSAGTNVACPTIKTTNDMPIVDCVSLNALNLIDFQINPHYLDPVPDSKVMGETREKRIMQFLDYNDIDVVGLREGSALKIDNKIIQLLGTKTARVFKKGEKPCEIAPGTELTGVLNTRICSNPHSPLAKLSLLQSIQSQTPYFAEMKSRVKLV